MPGAGGSHTHPPDFVPRFATHMHALGAHCWSDQACSSPVLSCFEVTTCCSSYFISCAIIDSGRIKFRCVYNTCMLLVVYPPISYIIHTGPLCVLAGVTRLPFGQLPLMLYNGEVSCQTLTGKISIVRLDTHNFQDDQELAEDEVQ